PNRFTPPLIWFPRESMPTARGRVESMRAPDFRTFQTRGKTRPAPSALIGRPAVPRQIAGSSCAMPRQCSSCRGGGKEIMAGTIARRIAAGVATGALAAVPGPAAAQEPPPGDGLSEQEGRAVAQQQRFVDQQAEFFLAASEAAQRRGDCAARASALASANVEIQTDKARAYVPPDVIESWEERLRAMEVSPCPPNDPLVEQRAIAIALAL